MQGVEVQITNSLHTSHFEKADVFMYNRIIPEEAVEKMNELRDYYGFSVCVDVDDYWLLDEFHPYYKDYKEYNFIKKQIAQIENANFVTVTHERLAGAVKPYNKNVHILSNAIPQHGQFTGVVKNKHPNDLVRLFWQGSATHLADIAELREAMIKVELSSCKHQVEAVMAGYIEDDLIWHEMAAMFTSRANLKHCLIGSLSYDYYYNTYAEADICLVPLRKSLFNGMKSNLKILEAANMKLPVIASKADPYKYMPVRYAVTPSDWFNHINTLVWDKTRRVAEGERLHEYCKEHFNFDKINEERRQVFEYYAATVNKSV